MANILIVDDELGIRESLFDILDDEGHTVTLAENAAQARAQRLAGAPDLVLLDIWMPDTDGVSLLKEWSSHGQLTMPVIMMSGHATIETAVAATKLGALSFLEKPIALQKLLLAVETGLGHARKLPQPSATSSVPLTDRGIAATSASPNPSPSASGPASRESPSAIALKPDYLLRLDQPLSEAKNEFERAYFSYHLEHEKGSVAKVAEKVGLERTHLYRKLKQLGF